MSTFKVSFPIVLLVILIYGFYDIVDNEETSSAVLYPTASPGEVSPFIPAFSDPIGSWTQGAVVNPEATMGHAESYVRNDTGWLYFMGGDRTFQGAGLNANRRYNVNTNTWTAMLPIPTPALKLHGMARLRDSIYTIGGMITGFSSETSVCRKYTIPANTWSTIASLPVIIAGTKAVGYQDSLIYCLGGVTGGTSTGVNNVYLYNVFSNTWRKATGLPAPRVMGACTIKGDTIIYVGGGITYFAGYNRVTYKGVISQTDRSVITWTTGANYPGTSGWRYDARPWGCKGIIIAGGGGNVTFSSSNECYLYSRAWTSGPSRRMSPSIAPTQE